MTIETHAPKKENAPLLPKSQDEHGSFDEFDGAFFTGALFNLSTTIVGAGIMALPAILKVLGLGLGVSIIIFMAFLTDASIEFLLRFSSAGKCASYGGLMGDAFGKYGRIMLQVVVLVNNVAVLIVYMISIGDDVVWNIFGWSSPFWCARGLVWSTLLDCTHLCPSYHNTSCICSPCLL